MSYRIATQGGLCSHDAGTGKENAGDTRRRTESTTVVGRILGVRLLVEGWDDSSLMERIDVSVEGSL